MNLENTLSYIEVEDLQGEVYEYIESHIHQTDADELSSIADLFKEWFELKDIDEDTERILALVEQTDDDYSTCKSAIDDSNWIVTTDDEADELWEESLNQYLDDCVLPELPESAQYYFNRDDWVSDAKMDGRGHSLSSYDGEEFYQTINGTTYYLYRCN